MLFELCTLKHPFDGSNQAALILKIICGKYPALPKAYSPGLLTPYTLIPKPSTLNPKH